MARKRHLSRVAVMQTLFERGTRSVDEKLVLQRNIAALIKEIGLVDEKFSASLLKAALKNEQAVIESLNKYAPEWPLDRMDPIARATLLVGATELLFDQDTPVPVVINEAIDIAKEYGGSEASKFVNGVLHTLSQNLSK